MMTREAEYDKLNKELKELTHKYVDFERKARPYLKEGGSDDEDGPLNQERADKLRDQL